MHDRERPGAGASTTQELAHGATVGTGPGKQSRTAQLAQHTPKVPGGALNVDIDALNQAHHGNDTARLGQSAELEKLEHQLKNEHSPDRKEHLKQKIAKIKREHLSYETTRNTHLFDNSGRVLIPVVKGSAVRINAGTLTKIIPQLDPANPSTGPAVDCVFVFQSYAPGSGKNAKPNTTGGWMPATDLPAAVGHEQHALATDIEKGKKDKHGKRHGGRHDADREFDAQPVPILSIEAAKANGNSLVDMFTYPPPKQIVASGRENQAQDYLGNLSLNIPHSGDPRFGVETTRIPNAGGPDPKTAPGQPLDKYHEFYPLKSHAPVTVKLYPLGNHQSTASMQFVYGYVLTNADAKIYGWINTRMLLPGFK